MMCTKIAILLLIYWGAISSASKEGMWKYTFKDSQYQLITTNGNFYSAILSCQNFGSQLVSIETSQEYKFIREMLSDQTIPSHEQDLVFWTSGNKLADKRTWVWLLNGERIRDFYWGSGEPNNAGGEEHCLNIVYARSGIHYNDDGCHKEFMAICERQVPIIEVPNARK